ncbi:MAG: hypothetical protein KUG78_01380 [Kangiellaceae bacterium]|nr:hypothetical protein [Kangiellaceae bacterium]
MRTTYNRKTSPKVIGGHVQRKNNHQKTAQQGYVVDRVKPSRGFIHVLSKRDIHDFVEMLPDWIDISVGIEAIFLASENEYSDAYYKHYSKEGTGVIWLCAWQKGLWIEYSDHYFQEHRWLFDTLGVICQWDDKQSIGADSEQQDSYWTCYFTLAQAKAFMLMHVFLHELGHHVDKQRSRKSDRMVGGERFAEEYANRRFKEIWPRYIAFFGNPIQSN